MSFLRRLFGGDEAVEPAASPAVSSAELAEDERQHELEVMREEARRLDDL